MVVGSVVAINLASVKMGKSELAPIAEEKTGYLIEDISVAQTSILIQRLVNVKSEATLLTQNSEGKIHSNNVKLPANGVISPVAAHYKKDQYLVSYQSFLHPSTLYQVNAKSNSLNKLYQQNALLNSASFVTEQHFATSKNSSLQHISRRPKGDMGAFFVV